MINIYRLEEDDRFNISIYRGEDEFEFNLTPEELKTLHDEISRELEKIEDVFHLFSYKKIFITLPKNL